MTLFWFLWLLLAAAGLFALAAPAGRATAARFAELPAAHAARPALTWWSPPRHDPPGPRTRGGPPGGRGPTPQFQSFRCFGFASGGC